MYGDISDTSTVMFVFRFYQNRVETYLHCVCDSPLRRTERFSELPVFNSALNIRVSRFDEPSYCRVVYGCPRFQLYLAHELAGEPDPAAMRLERTLRLRAT